MVLIFEATVKMQAKERANKMNSARLKECLYKLKIKPPFLTGQGAPFAWPKVPCPPLLLRPLLLIQKSLFDEENC
jgi:hypothetical protein